MTPQELVTREKQEVAGQEKTRPGRYFQPDVDICEYDDYLKLWAEMPGVKDKDLKLTLEDDVLTIEGLVDIEPYKNLSPVYTEYNVGNYFRQFTLGESIDESGIQAMMRDGVLELTLPKTAKAKLRRIGVQAG